MSVYIKHSCVALCLHTLKTTVLYLLVYIEHTTTQLKTIKVLIILQQSDIRYHP